MFSMDATTRSHTVRVEFLKRAEFATEVLEVLLGPLDPSTTPFEGITLFTHEPRQQNGGVMANRRTERLDLSSASIRASNFSVAPEAYLSMRRMASRIERGFADS